MAQHEWFLLAKKSDRFYISFPQLSMASEAEEEEGATFINIEV